MRFADPGTGEAAALRRSLARVKADVVVLKRMLGVVLVLTWTLVLFALLATRG